MELSNLLFLFHHLHHHEDGTHEIPHCGNDHVATDPLASYTIHHCACKKHCISVQIAKGHAMNAQLESPLVCVCFKEPCPEEGWHIESGIIIEEKIYES